MQFKVSVDGRGLGCGIAISWTTGPIALLPSHPLTSWFTTCCQPSARWQPLKNVCCMCVCCKCIACHPCARLCSPAMCLHTHGRTEGDIDNAFMCTLHLCSSEAVLKIVHPLCVCVRVVSVCVWVGGQASKGGSSPPPFSDEESRGRDRGGWRKRKEQCPLCFQPLIRLCQN